MSDNVVLKKRLWDFLGSRDLSVFIFVMGCTYALILVIFAAFIPTPWVNRIATLLPFKILYLLFLINLIICEIKWIPVILRRCKAPNVPETKEELERYRHKLEIKDLRRKTEDFIKYLRRKGYRLQTQDLSNQSSVSGLQSSVLLYAYKGRFSPFGNVMFHGGFLFLLLGIFVGIFGSSSASVMLMEGEGMENPPMRVEKVTPTYWGERLLFTDLKADVTYPYNGELRSRVVRLSQPLRLEGARVTIGGVGFSPMYLLRDKDGMELDRGYVRMNIFPPGTLDHFKIPGYPHQIFVSFYPDYEMKDGRLTSRSMNPVNPAYFIRVFRNRVPSYSGILKPGEEAYFEGLRLSFPEFKYWGQFKIVRNPGFIYIWIAFMLFITGLVWRLLLYRREFAVVQEGEALFLYGNSDYYHRLFEDRLRMLAEGEV